MSSSSTAPAEGESQEGSPPLVFTVKSSNDAKYPVTLPPSTTIAELKTKLSELSEIPTERQRLIYSGRVMKDDETLSFYKVQSGHTIHLVKGAASNQRAGATSNPTASPGTSAASGIPTNIAAGSGNNPLAGLTGARYAGLAPLPNADIFGPDGGMGPPPDADQMYSIMNTPGFQSTMNEMLQNPQMLEYIINSNPALRSIPGAREMMQSPEFRQMMTNPDMIRQASAMQRAFGGRGGAGAPPAFPEPGRTDTTPVPPSSNPQSPQPAVNPFGANPAAGNPFSALLGMPGMVPRGWPGFGNPADPAQGTPTNPPAAGTAPIPNQPPSAVNIPGHNPLQTNPEVDWNRIGQALRQAYGAGGLPIVPPGAGGVPPPNPFSMFGMPPLGTQAPPAPVDTRPPEERYAEQLRQLNDMGFYDFDRNIEALRRTGGSVQGAIQHLLGD